MLRWTEAGAVSSPTTLQIRISKRYERRIRAGAPEPSRKLSYKEIEDNVHNFRHTLNTPRTRNCTSITLSGLQEETPQSLLLLRSILENVGFDYTRAHVDTKSRELLQHLNFAHHISISISELNEWQLHTIPTTLLPKIQVTILLFTGYL
jgi:hypothetical protein